MKYNTILFDADGTLLDFHDAEHQALVRTFADYNLHFDDTVNELYQQINNSLWRQFEQGIISREILLASRFAELFKQLHLENVDSDKFNSDYLYNLGYGSQTISRAIEVCQKLHLMGCRLYILTNGVAATQRRRLDASGLMPYLSGIFVSEEIGFQKPLREYFDYVFSQIPSFEPDKALMVGDSLSSDIEGANRAGIDSCWFNPDEKPIPTKPVVTFNISSLDEIIDLL